MADLPKDRMCIDPPFTYCGVDIFGPFVVKDDRKEVKKHGALYTCLLSRAIHIEFFFFFFFYSLFYVDIKKFTIVY